LTFEIGHLSLMDSIPKWLRQSIVVLEFTMRLLFRKTFDQWAERLRARRRNGFAVAYSFTVRVPWVAEAATQGFEV